MAQVAPEPMPDGSTVTGYASNVSSLGDKARLSFLDVGNSGSLKRLLSLVVTNSNGTAKAKNSSSTSSEMKLVAVLTPTKIGHSVDEELTIGSVFLGETFMKWFDGLKFLRIMFRCTLSITWLVLALMLSQPMDLLTPAVGWCIVGVSGVLVLIDSMFFSVTVVFKAVSGFEFLFSLFNAGGLAFFSSNDDEMCRVYIVGLSVHVLWVVVMDCTISKYTTNVTTFSILGVTYSLLGLVCTIYKKGKEGVHTSEVWFLNFVFVCTFRAAVSWRRKYHYLSYRESVSRIYVPIQNVKMIECQICTNLRKLTLESTTRQYFSRMNRTSRWLFGLARDALVLQSDGDEMITVAVSTQPSFVIDSFLTMRGCCFRLHNVTQNVNILIRVTQMGTALWSCWAMTGSLFSISADPLLMDVLHTLVVLTCIVTNYSKVNLILVQYIVGNFEAAILFALLGELILLLCFIFQDLSKIWKSFMIVIFLVSNIVQEITMGWTRLDRSYYLAISMAVLIHLYMGLLGGASVYYLYARWVVLTISFVFGKCLIQSMLYKDRYVFITSFTRPLELTKTVYYMITNTDDLTKPNSAPLKP